MTQMADRNDGIAGVNAGYFVVGEKDGTPGDLAGIFASNGQLVSEAINGRSALILSSVEKKADILLFPLQFRLLHLMVQLEKWMD